jgi:hypothetical protein
MMVLPSIAQTAGDKVICILVLICESQNKINQRCIKNIFLLNRFSEKNDYFRKLKLKSFSFTGCHFIRIKTIIRTAENSTGRLPTERQKRRKR